MFNFLRNEKKEEYVDCFFCDMKPTKKQAFEFQYSAEGVVHSVNICPLCAGTLNKIVDERNSLNE